ncbi:thioredoxin family protein [Rossellomorea sp. SC111]|uniref:thioredoxin family protein n=1 Tax=Rossellomorea sp. SC111 TaxID=2968985 RepID=UPI00215A29FD|nr:thioredoxin family protein [Rossellomorea sp. SC111]MCR8848857.1 thioredoxin family protein [Rossellomorea sp. SC111]
MSIKTGQDEQLLNQYNNPEGDRKMEEVHSLEAIHEKLENEKLILLYISRPDCSVCHALLPQVEEMLKDFKSVRSIHADAEEIPEIAGEFSIFTVPVIIVFVDGKEMFRKARFVPIDELRSRISRLTEMLDN